VLWGPLCLPCRLTTPTVCRLQVLQPPHGVVYVAAKSFYFGVGGSTASFSELVKADGVLECTQVTILGCAHASCRLHCACGPTCLLLWAVAWLLQVIRFHGSLGFFAGPHEGL
jgi:hypothetical protein